MSGYRKIQAYFLIIIYAILLLHDVVPHSHVHHEDGKQDISHSHAAADHEHEETSGLWGLLKGLFHSHTEVTDAQHHELAYKTNSAELPDWQYTSIPMLVNIVSSETLILSKCRNQEYTNFYWQSREPHSPKCLRAPPMS